MKYAKRLISGSECEASVALVGATPETGGVRKLRWARGACRLIVEILGHAQIAITMNLYAHVIPTMQKEVAARMDEVLAPPKPVAHKPPLAAVN